MKSRLRENLLCGLKFGRGHLLGTSARFDAREFKDAV